MSAASSCDVGVMGLSVMGKNLALNIASKNFKVAVWNRSESRTAEIVSDSLRESLLGICPSNSVEEFVNLLKKPRIVLVLVQAGPAVDEVLTNLEVFLCSGDVIFDCGNEWYKNTQRRQDHFKTKDIIFMGMGVSGGEDGARLGPSLMPGGPPSGYEKAKHILTVIAAQTPDGPCVTYIGPGGAGQYVKMVHNGIEYGFMQLIAEAFDILMSVCGLTYPEAQEVFKKWNEKELKSFLIEITSKILGRKDDQSSSLLIEKVLDQAGSKGTGKWTVKDAVERGIPLSTIAAAVDVRNISNLTGIRNAAIKFFSNSRQVKKPDISTDDVFDALYCSVICAFAQGMMLLQVASCQEGWKLKLDQISNIWKGGCIIRAEFLNLLSNAFVKNPDLQFILLDRDIADDILKRHSNWRGVINQAVLNCVPVPALSASLGYFDNFAAAKLPLNLIQAQRDCFGAHTYRRNDTNEVCHSQWIV